MTRRSSLYAGRVYHKRFRPAVHELNYSVFSWLLDLQELQQLHDELPVFSYNRLNIFSFYDKDFGEKDGEPLPDYVRRKLIGSDIHEFPTRILVSCYPRVLGYVFNPLTLFYCLDDNDHCFAVLHEVHNTFGERHAYALKVLPEAESRQGNGAAGTGGQGTCLPGEQSSRQGSGRTGSWITQSANKELFVSPFAHMDMNYRFRLNVPAEHQRVVIIAGDASGPVISASYSAVRCPLDSRQLLRFFFRVPFLTLKVIAAIHVEALRLWFKGVPAFKHQPKRDN